MNKRLKRMLGMCVVFDGDAGAGDVNVPNAGGGKDEDKGGGGGGSDNSDDKGKNDKKSAGDETHEVKINGEDRSLTLTELKDLASKAGGADAKFQDAADLTKKAETGIRIGELMKSINAAENPDKKEVQELAVLFEVDPQELLAGVKKPPQSGDKGDKGGKKTDLTKEQIAEALGIDVDDLKATLEYSKQRHVADARKELRELSDKAVDKDEIFGKIIVGEQKEDRLSVIKDLVSEDVFRKISQGEVFGAELVAASVQKIRAHLVKFGIPSKPALAPIVLGSGPGGILPAEVQADKPIERISTFAEGGEENAIQRYYQKALKAKRDLLG